MKNTCGRTRAYATFANVERINARLLLCTLLGCASSVQAQRDSSAAIISTSFGFGLEPLDDGALNRYLDDAHLHRAGDVSGTFRFDLMVSGNRFLVDFGESIALRTAHTDSSSIRTNVIALRACFGYPVVRQRRLLIAPIIGYQFTDYSYQHAMDLTDHAFGNALHGAPDNVDLNYTRHSLITGFYFSYGRHIGISASGGYMVPLGNGTWIDANSGSKLSGAPSLVPGFFGAIGIALRLSIPSFSLPYC